MNENYLEHHGVKGMRWGVRRDKKAYAKKFRDKEVSKLRKRREKELTRGHKILDEAEQKYEKRLNKLGPDSPKTLKAEKKYINKMTNVLSRDAINQAEINKVMSMKYSDIKKEKTDVGKQVATDFLVTAGSLSLVYAGASPIGFVQGTNVRELKTQMRVPDEEQIKHIRKAYEVSMDYVYNSGRYNNGTIYVKG